MRDHCQGSQETNQSQVVGDLESTCALPVGNNPSVHQNCCESSSWTSRIVCLITYITHQRHIFVWELTNKIVVYFSLMCHLKVAIVKIIIKLFPQ